MTPAADWEDELTPAPTGGRNLPTGERLIRLEVLLVQVKDQLNGLSDNMVTRSHCDAIQASKPARRDLLSVVSDWLKLLLMIGAIIGGYLALHDLKISRSQAPRITVQPAKPQPVMVLPYRVPADAGTPHPLRRRTPR